MAKLLYALIAQRVLTDRDTNSVSYIEMVDGFNVPALPIQLPPFVVGTSWGPAEGEGALHVRMAFVGPDNEVIGSHLEVPEQQFSGLNRHRVNVNFAGVPIALPGEYSVRVEQKRGNDWVEERHLALAVNYVPPQPQFVIPSGGQKVPLRRL